jgi:hypothetical protein
LAGKIKYSKYTTLVKRLTEIIHSARATAVRQINKAQVLAYYEIGREIVKEINRDSDSFTKNRCHPRQRNGSIGRRAALAAGGGKAY